MLYFLQLSSDDSNISNNAQGQGQGHVKVEAVQALHLEAYRLVCLSLTGTSLLSTGPIFTKFAHKVPTYSAPWTSHFGC